MLARSSSSSKDGSAAAESVPPWLELPDPCLVAVLRCCAATDPRTLFNAARAHSRLRQAAAVAGLDSISGFVRQQQVDSLQLYLSKHGQHVRSISLEGVDPGRSFDERCRNPIPATLLRELPANLARLQSASFRVCYLQLQPGGGHRGVLSGLVGAHLKRLELRCCGLLDGAAGLAAALAQLPGLDHLCVSFDYDKTESMPVESSRPAAEPRPDCSTRQLTYLELQLDSEQRPEWSTSVDHWSWQLLMSYTRLADLRLALGPATVTPGMLPSAQHLTRLDLQSSGGRMSIDPARLGGATQLQHLELDCDLLLPDEAAGTAELLRQLQQLQQLTALVLFAFWQALGPEGPPAAAFSALTASSKLRDLRVTYCTLPTGAWEHVFPAARQLPHLTALDVSGASDPTGVKAAPSVSRLASCCPGLHSLKSCLPPEADFGALAQLTGLKDLDFYSMKRDLMSAAADARLLQLTRLVQLTRLRWFVNDDMWTLTSQAPGDEPVWRQLLRCLLNSSNPEVAQQAAAGLAGLELEPQENVAVTVVADH